MRPILIDTNAYTAFKYGNSAITEVIQAATVIAMTPIVLGELLGGFDSGTKSVKNRDELHKFLSSARVQIFSVSADTANFYAQVYSKLRAKGNPIPTNDMWIAALALEQGCVVCTLDNHFSAIEGLVTGSTLSELTV
jgi:tRNA(fMet)-specific endonuclease VapC